MNKIPFTKAQFKELQRLTVNFEDNAAYLEDDMPELQNYITIAGEVDALRVQNLIDAKENPALVEIIPDYVPAPSQPLPLSTKVLAVLYDESGTELVLHTEHESGEIIASPEIDVILGDPIFTLGDLILLGLVEQVQITPLEGPGRTADWNDLMSHAYENPSVPDFVNQVTSDFSVKGAIQISAQQSAELQQLKRNVEGVYFAIAKILDSPESAWYFDFTEDYEYANDIFVDLWNGAPYTIIS